MAYAQAGLREATGISTLTVVSVSGGPSDWWVSYEIPASGMDRAAVSSLADQVRRKLSRLEDSGSPEFAAFARGAASTGSGLHVQGIAVASGPSVTLSGDLKELSHAFTTKGSFVAAPLALFGTVLRYFLMATHLH